MLLVGADLRTEERSLGRRLAHELERRAPGCPDAGDRHPARALLPLDDDDPARVLRAYGAVEVDLPARAAALERDLVLDEHDRRREEAAEAGLVGRSLRGPDERAVVSRGVGRR